VAATFYGFCSCRNITRLKEAYQRHTALEKSKAEEMARECMSRNYQNGGG
jgi:hypothetical protein